MSKKIREIRDLRLALKMTQVEFAKAMGVSQPQVSYWERSVNEIPREKVKILVRLAKSKKLNFDFY